jgi:uncharacterized protein (TIGR03435 family)
MRIRFFAPICFVPCLIFAQSTPKVASDVRVLPPRAGVTIIKPSDPNSDNRFYTMRGSHFVAQNQTVSNLIEIAYGLQHNQVDGGPPWIRDQKFDLEAAPDRDGKYSYKEWNLMLQQILADRFQLTCHHENREVPAYLLVETRAGSKLSASSPDTDAVANIDVKKSDNAINVIAAHAAMSDFVKTLTEVVIGQPVIDRTGIEGQYDFTLRFGPDRKDISPTDQPAETEVPAGLFTAIQEQLGLMLEPTKAAVDVLVIDKVSEPSAN